MGADLDGCHAGLDGLPVRGDLTDRDDVVERQ
jgi:hypothetical protein